MTAKIYLSMFYNVLNTVSEITKIKYVQIWTFPGSNLFGWLFYIIKSKVFDKSVKEMKLILDSYLDKFLYTNYNSFG